MQRRLLERRLGGSDRERTGKVPAVAIRRASLGTLRAVAHHDARLGLGDLCEPRRVFIVGNSGSGKSTLATELRAQLSIPHLDLDDVAFVDQVGTRRDVEASQRMIERRLGRGRAVIDGCYGDIITRAATEHDHLVWLDLPVEV